MKTKLTAPQTKFHKLKCKFPLFVGGYGSGKTYMLEICCVQDLVENPSANIALYCPTYDLLKLNLIPRIQGKLDEMKLYHFINKGDHIITVMGFGSFIFRSMDNPDRIIGYEVFRSHCDEIDLLTQKKADLVWNRIIARNRQKIVNPLWRRAKIRFENGSKSVTEHWFKTKSGGEDVCYLYKDKKIMHYKRNKVSAYTTPESFGFTYNRWGRNAARGYQYVVAPTYTNKHLQDDYIDSLRDTYTAKMVEAYIEGRWVNLTTGSVYPYFDRDDHHTGRVVQDDEPLHIGLDFNVGKMTAIVFGANGRSAHRPMTLEVIDEIVGYPDTPALIKAIKKRYEGGNHRITVYPDAAGKNRNTTNVTITDHRLLKKAGFKVKALKANPLVRDRIASVNKFFEDDILYVNTDTCPELTNALEQQAYNEKGAPDKNSDLDHPCFKGDTLVKVNGEIMELQNIPRCGKIESVNGVVSYTNGGLVQKNQPMLTLKLTDGRQLTCTPEHRFLTANGKWVEARNLKGCQLLSKNSKVFDTTFVTSTFKTPLSLNTCTEWFMNTTMVKFLKGLTYTIKTTINQTMIYPILNQCPELSIANCTLTTLKGGRVETMLKQSTKLETGTSQMKVKHSIRSNMTKVAGCMINQPWSVNNAVKNIKALATGVTDFVHQNVRRDSRLLQVGTMRKGLALYVKENSQFIKGGLQKHVAEVAAVSYAPETYDSYCVTTEQGHFTLADGTITSNCDALGYRIAYDWLISKPKINYEKAA